jgi:plastocyanin/predicted phosphodiesterase
MNKELSRREFVKLAGAAVIGAPFAGLFFEGGAAAGDGFYFLQLTDTHWGFDKPAINPDFAGTLKKAFARVNALPRQPDFIVFTGDLTHTTDDDKVRRQRMFEFKEMVKGLTVQNIKFLPGEHDASLDGGKAFQDFFGATHYAFEHKGVHFIALDNVSDPRGIVGDAQLAWLHDELKKLAANDRLIILTHRPLFDLAPDWDWATRDGGKVLELLAPFHNVSVLYGHIHQVNRQKTGAIEHNSAMGLMYSFPAPHAVPKKAAIPWDPTHPYAGLGYREAQLAPAAAMTLVEIPLVAKAAAAAGDAVIAVTAKQFEFKPSEITVKKGVPVVLAFTSLDKTHGFNCPGLKIRTDIPPGKTTEVRLVAEQTGRFPFHCDVFCGDGHEDMTGTIIVTE